MIYLIDVVLFPVTIRGILYNCFFAGVSHGIKRHLLLRRKVMTNLDSILKSRDITLSIKVHLVKGIVFQ